MRPNNLVTHKVIPVADGSPLVGSAFPLLADPLDFFLQQYRKFGSVYRIKALGRNYVVLAGPDASRFFRKNSEELFDGSPIYAPYARDIKSNFVMVAMEGEEHAKWRSALQPAFAKQNLTKILPDLISLLDDGIAQWQSGSQLNVLDAFNELASRSCGKAMTGCPFNRSMKHMSRFAHTFLGAGVGSFPDFIRSLPSYRKSRKVAMDFFQEVNDSSNKSSKLFVRLIDEYRKSNGEPLSENDCIANLQIPYTNSLVYVGALAGFMLNFLLRDVDVLNKCRKEAELLLQDERQPTVDEILVSKWLAASLKETQRLQPISLSAPRIAKEDFEFNGYSIDKGQPLLIATAVCHYLDDFYISPNQFDPTRFLEKNNSRPAEAFAPFGFDQHTCIAANLVRLTVTSMIAKIIKRFDISTLNHLQELKLQIAPFPVPHRSWKIQLTERIPEPIMEGEFL